MKGNIEQSAAMAEHASQYLREEMAIVNRARRQRYVAMLEGGAIHGS